MHATIGQFKQLSEERPRFAAQLGASGVLLDTPMLLGGEEKVLETLPNFRRLPAGQAPRWRRA